MARTLIMPARRGWARRLRRTALAAMLVIAALTTTPGPQPADAATAAVTWEVVHANKTIELTVNLAVFVSSPPTTGQQLQRVNDVIDTIKKGITDAWNGQRFKCYTLVVRVNVRLVNDQGDVRDDEVPVMLDAGIYPQGTKSAPFRSHVAVGSSAENHLSDEHQFDPTTGSGARPSRWALAGTGLEYAHEFGHILGLGDTYVEGTGIVKEGAVKDLMTQPGPLKPQTVVKAVRRSGKVDESLIKCPLLIDLARSKAGIPGLWALELELHGCAPDYTPPSTDPTQPGKVEFHGALLVFGDYLSAFPTLGGAKDEALVNFTARWIQGETEIDVLFPSGQISQDVLTRAQGPLARDSNARLKNSGGTLVLDHIMKITPYDGPCR